MTGEMDLQMLTEELNGELLLAEETLASRKLGVSVEAPLSRGALAFMEHGGRWRLVFADRTGETLPLVDAPCELRVEAAKKLDGLCEQLAMKASDQLREMREAIGEVRAFNARSCGRNDASGLDGLAASLVHAGSLRYFVHEVRPGETLCGIARRFDVTSPSPNMTAAHWLARLNRIGDPDHIEAGWLIAIPTQEQEERSE